MLANIALGQCSINSIGHRMHPDIGIGMAEQTKFMGQGDTAKRDLCARSKLMDIKSVAQA